MVNFKREGLGLLIKLGRAIALSEDLPEEPEETTPAVDPEAEPMKAYWESDKEELNKKNQPFIDLFLKGVALDRIPDTTDKPVQESHYKFDPTKFIKLPEGQNVFDLKGKVLSFFELSLKNKYTLVKYEDTQIRQSALGNILAASATNNISLLKRRLKKFATHHLL